jgi:hypothetical protein
MEAIQIQLSNEPRKVKEHRFLDVSQIIMIDEALTSLGEYGEVRLIVERGRLRYLVTQKSYDALKWQPGSLDDSEK